MEALILNGCVSNSLKFGLIVKADLLNYIIDNPHLMESMVAYRQLCVHDLEHEDFFDRLDKSMVPVYSYIHVLSGGKTHNIKIKKSSVEALLQLNQTIQSLCGYNEKGAFTIAGMNLVSVSKDNYKHFVAYDRIETLTIKSELDLLIVLERMKLLKIMTLYWSLMKPKYIELLKRNNITDLVSIKTINLIKDVVERDDGVIIEAMFDLNDVTLQIYKASRTIKAYMLGLEFFFHNTSDGEIENRLTLASTDHDGLVSLIQQHPSYTITATNTTDTLSEEWKNYLPFDIYSYNDGTHVFVFTRPEFEWILGNKKNPWNNNPLPTEVLNYIEFLANFAFENKLPKSKPMKEMWTNPEFVEEQGIKSFFYRIMFT